jgi:hypothetical protein
MRLNGLERIGGKHGSIFPRSDGRFAANACGGTVITRLAAVAGAEVVHRDPNTLTATFPEEALSEVARILRVWQRFDDAT